MIELTAHCMLANEEVWIGHVLEPLLDVCEQVLIYDCASKDRTPEIIQAVLASKDWPAEVEFVEFDVMSPKLNGRVRQMMTDRTKTEWAIIVDGDEYTPVEMLRAIKQIGMPEGKKLGFTSYQTVQFIDGQFWKGEKFGKQSLFHAPTSIWRGDYPWESPHWYDFPETYYHFKGIPEGIDLHYLQRSPLDESTYHRKDNTRVPQPVTEPMILPLDLSKWENPYNVS